MAIPVFSEFKIPVFWDDEFKNLEYVHEKFNDRASLDLWQQQGYGPSVTGAMCDMRSSQPSWNNQFVKIFNDMGWKDIGTSYYCMSTGTVMPVHSDLYLKYVDIFKLQTREHSIMRAVVFLEDWKSGHYSEVAGCPIVNWRAGQCIMWSYDTPHSAANLGLDDRYTLQITGHL